MPLSPEEWDRLFDRIKPALDALSAFQADTSERIAAALGPLAEQMAQYERGPLAEQMANIERAMQQVATSLPPMPDLGVRLSALLGGIDWSALQDVTTPVGATLDLRWQVDAPATVTDPITVADVMTLVGVLVALMAVGAFASEGQQAEAWALCSALLWTLADQWRRSE